MEQAANFRLNLGATLINKQAFRFYGNEIHDYGYCEPIGHGIHVYTAELATLFVSKTTELRSDDGQARYCVGRKQAQYYRAGYDAGRAWFARSFDLIDPSRFGDDEPVPGLIAQLHFLAFHKKTIFDTGAGTGVYGAKLIDHPIDRKSLRWAGYYAAITAGIIDLVTKHTALFHQHETCDRLTEGWTKKDVRAAKRHDMNVPIPCCLERTYVIEKQAKIPLDMTDLLNTLNLRTSDNRPISRDELPNYLQTLGFSEVGIKQAPQSGTCQVFVNEGPVTNLIVHLKTDDTFELVDGREGNDTVYWTGTDPNELINQVLRHASNLNS